MGVLANYTNPGDPNYLDIKRMGGGKVTYYSDVARQEVTSNRYEAFGNYLYGFVGTAGGIPDIHLLLAADLMQSGGLGDDPVDAIHVAKGHSGCNGLSAVAPLCADDFTIMFNSKLRPKSFPWRKLSALFSSVVWLQPSWAADDVLACGFLRAPHSAALVSMRLVRTTGAEALSILTCERGFSDCSDAGFFALPTQLMVSWNGARVDLITTTDPIVYDTQIPPSEIVDRRIVGPPQFQDVQGHTPLALTFDRERCEAIDPLPTK